MNFPINLSGDHLSLRELKQKSTSRREGNVRLAISIKIAAARFATVLAVAVGVGASFIILEFNNLTDYLRLLFSFFNDPLFAAILLGMLWKRTTSLGAFWGLLTAMLAALATSFVSNRIPRDRMASHPDGI